MMTARREANLHRLLDEVTSKDPGWLMDYLSAKNIRPVRVDSKGILQDVRFSILDDSKEQLLWKLVRDAWRQRRAKIKKRATNRVTHTITISAEAEIYLRSRYVTEDKSISNVIDELLVQKSKAITKKQKSKAAHSSTFNL